MGCHLLCEVSLENWRYGLDGVAEFGARLRMSEDFVSLAFGNFGSLFCFAHLGLGVRQMHFNERFSMIIFF